MEFATLAFIAVVLTVALYATREFLLGFPSAIAWIILGLYCYGQSTAAWDFYYSTFYFSAVGMVIVTAISSIVIGRAERAKDQKSLLEGTEDIGQGIDPGSDAQMDYLQADFEVEGSVDFKRNVVTNKAPFRRRIKVRKSPALKRAETKQKQYPRATKSLFGSRR